MNIYTGGTNKKGVPLAVRVNDRILDPGPSQKIHNHSPDGFAWGYGGSGPAQLALAILLLELSEKEALTHYQQFKREIIALLPTDAGTRWQFSGEQITDWLYYGLAPMALVS